MRSIAVLLIAALASLLATVHAYADDATPWTGDWDLTWSAGGAHARLVQTGDSITGEILLVGSKIEGKVDGDRFTGTRVEAGCAHALVLILGRGGNTLVGHDDSRGWCTAIRIASDSIPAAPPLDSPRAAFAEFTFVANQLRLGLDGYWNRVIGSAEFAPEALALVPEERLSQLRGYFGVIDLTTFDIREFPTESTQNEVTVPLRQLRSDALLPVVIRRGTDNRWRVVVPNLDGIVALRKTLLPLYGAKPPTEQSFRGLHTPRDAMRTFLEGTVTWSRGGEEIALSTLDLSALPEALRGIDGKLAAGYLCRALKNIGFRELQSIPNDPTNRDPVVLFEHPEGSIVIAPIGPEPDAPWKFTAASVDSIRRVYFMTAGLPPRQDSSLGVIPPMASFELRDFFGARFPALLTRRIGLEIWQVLMLVVVLISAIGIGRIAARAVCGILRRVTHSIAPMPEPLRDALWLLFTVSMLYPVPGLLGLPHHSQSAVVPVVGTFASIALGIVAWYLVAVVCMLLSRATGRTDDLALNLLRGCLRVGVITGAFIVAAYAWSIPATHVLAGLGIGGIGVAFASQQTIAQFFGAGVLVGDRTFGVGDWIQCSGGVAGTLSGVVEGVGFRSTRIRSADGSVLSVPNGALAAVTIVNFGRRRPRPLSLQITVTQGATLERVERFIATLRERMSVNPAFLEGSVAIGVSGIVRDGILVQCNALAAAKTDQEEADARHAFLVDVLALADEQGLGLGPQLARTADASAKA
jgi:MscS family membrane protein